VERGPRLRLRHHRFLAGEADFFENLRPEYLGRTTRNEALRLLPYPSLDYGFLQFNLRDPRDADAPHPSSRTAPCAAP
jgi:hypothetical protein